MASEFVRSELPLDVDGVDVNVAAIHREGKLEPIVFLHGFGSTKEDYADIVRYSAFTGHPFVAYDAPGCGETRCADLSRLSIPFLVETAWAVIRSLGYKRFHLVGHSMGGLSALMLADAHPHRVLSFVNIEGNIAPEDCFLSRQIAQYPRPIRSDSSTSSSSARAKSLPMPARCTPPAYGTRSAPAPYPASSSRWSGSPITVG
jgi:pimeloyl-ACP methyl ester carboxylesterase